MLLPHGAVVAPRCRARAISSSISISIGISSRHDKPLLEVRKGRDSCRGGLVVVRGHRLAQTLDGLCPTHRGIDVGERLLHAGLGRVELANFPGDALGQGGGGGDALGEVLGVGAEGGDRLEGFVDVFSVGGECRGIIARSKSTRLI